MEKPEIEDRLLKAKLSLCLATLKAITEFCEHVGISKDGLDTRSKAIKAVDGWL